jgi:alpha-galactosidase
LLTVCQCHLCPAVSTSQARADADSDWRCWCQGWGTWNLFGCWGYNWTEVDVRQMADAIVKSGMKDAGYSYVNLDGGWMGSREEDGTPIPNPTMFPSGMAALAQYVHSKGLRFGIYRDRHEGLGHEVADAKQFAKWECDYVKNDGYGNSTEAYSNGMTATEVCTYSFSPSHLWLPVSSVQ